MKQYVVTAKLWIKVDADSENEAKNKAKTLVDDALYYYSNTVKIEPMGISKAKIIYTKENTKKEDA